MTGFLTKTLWILPVALLLTGCATAPADNASSTRMLIADRTGSSAQQPENPIADITVSAAENDDQIRATAIGNFSTTFNPKNKSRSYNIALASDAINNRIIMPNETFSYNETVGPTSKKQGYKLGTIFIKGRMYEGYGGGVCQVSSTLYNAAANAGMDIIERHDHSMPVPYIETGRDAATSYGGIDFKFMNNKTYPVKIESHVDNGTISVTLNAI